MSEKLINGTESTESSHQENTFEPIKSQEDLDKIIGARVARERKKYEGFEVYKEKAEKYDAFEESQKTEMQKLNERLENAEKENAAYKQREQLAGWAKEVSDTSGVPTNLLRGSTKEELMAHADELKAFMGEQPTAPVVPSDGQKPKHKTATTADLFAEALGDKL